MGRPRKFESDTDRQRAYRDRYAVFQVRLLKDTAATLDSIAAELDVPRTEVVNACINFALLNYNWRTLGLFGKRLPYAKNPIDQTE